MKRGPWSSRPAARRHSASGWFSGRALSNAGSFRQAASTATIFGKAIERDLQPPRVEHLRHQADIGERHLRAAGIGSGRDHGFDRVEAFDHPMVVPGVDLGLFVLELTLDVLQRDEIVERMNVAGDHLRNGAHFGAFERVGRQERRLGMGLVEIFDDRQRLGQNLAAGKLERRDALLRIERAEFRLVLRAAVLGQMNGCHLIRQTLEIERDTHAIGGGRAEISIELHGRASGVDGDGGNLAGAEPVGEPPLGRLSLGGIPTARSKSPSQSLSSC